MYPPPRIHPSELRPRRGWYVVAAVLAGLMIIAGGLGFALGILHAVTSVKIGTRFTAGQHVTVTLNSDRRHAIYARVPDGYTPAYPQATCQAAGPGTGFLPLRRPTGGSGHITINGVTWQEVYVFDAPTAGRYGVTCQSQEVADFSVGDAWQTSRVIGGVVGGLVALLLVPAGIVIGGFIAILVGVRRGRHRRRLLAERCPPQY